MALKIRQFASHLVYKKMAIQHEIKLLRVQKRRQEDHCVTPDHKNFGGGQAPQTPDRAACQPERIIAPDLTVGRRQFLGPSDLDRLDLLRGLGGDTLSFQFQLKRLVFGQQRDLNDRIAAGSHPQTSAQRVHFARFQQPFVQQ